MQLSILKKSLENALRVQDWRFSFIPVIFGLLYLFILFGNGTPNLATWLLLAGSLMTSFGFASLGYLINEWTDIAEDTKAGKHNKLLGFTQRQRVGLFFLVVSFLGLPWVFLPSDFLSLVLIFIEILLFVLYSIPPFRLKNKLLLPNIIDALYAYVVPILLALHTFVLHYGQFSFHIVFLSLLFGLLFTLGMRNIFIHQINDLHHDMSVGKKTLPVALGLQHANRFLIFLMCIETGLIVLLLLNCFVSKTIPFLLLMLLGWLWVSYKNQIFQRPIVNHVLVYHPVRHLYDPIYQLFFPLIILLVLLLQSLNWWPLLLLHFWLFVPKAYLHLIYANIKLFTSYAVNYSIWFFFLCFGIDLKKRNQSALEFLQTLRPKS